MNAENLTTLLKGLIQAVHVGKTPLCVVESAVYLWGVVALVFLLADYNQDVCEANIRA
jgi:hypothetical protein